MPWELDGHAVSPADVLARLLHLRGVLLLILPIAKHLQYLALSFHLCTSDTDFFAMGSLLFARLSHVSFCVHQLLDVNATGVLLLQHILAIGLLLLGRGNLMK